jgi:hypothetical protein
VREARHASPYEKEGVAGKGTWRCHDDVPGSLVATWWHDDEAATARMGEGKGVQVKDPNG